jgi:hypothetical protein
LHATRTLAIVVPFNISFAKTVFSFHLFSL